jgi:hypothetical protein
MTRNLGIERRRYRRVETGYPVTLFAQGETYRVKATNLSTGGMFIGTKLPLTSGTLVHLRMHVSGGSVQATAQVRFVQPDIGVGLRFLEIGEADLARVTELIEKSSLEKEPEIEGVKLRDTRLRLSIKLTLEGKEQDGQHFCEEVYTEDVSRRGVCVRTARQLGVGDLIRLTGLDGQFEVEAVVKYTHACEGGWRTGAHFLTTPKRWVMMGMAVSALSQWEIRSLGS